MENIIEITSSKSSAINFLKLTTFIHDLNTFQQSLCVPGCADPISNNSFAQFYKFKEYESAKETQFDIRTREFVDFLQWIRIDSKE